MKHIASTLSILILGFSLFGCSGGGSGAGGGNTQAFAVSTTTATYGVVGNAYSSTLTATGGTAPFIWTVSGGVLPVGLTLNATNGVVTGTPAAPAGNVTTTFTVSDSTGKTATGSVLFAIHPRTDRVSVDGSGASGNGASPEAAINSTDGRFIAFTSLATNLTVLPGGSGSQVFIHDRQTGLPSLVSRVNLGNAGNGASNQPTISADGRYVAFTSAATNLAPIVGGGGTQVFLRDTQTNQTILVSRDTLGNAGNGASSQPAISADGRYVAFTSAATNLASIAGGSGTQVFLRDTQANLTSLVSRNPAGNAGNGASSEGAISGNGQFVAFTSQATNLASLVGASGSQVYLRDTIGNLTSVVSRDAAGDAGNGASSQPTISGNGQFIAFTSQATNLASLVGASGSQIYLRNTIGNLTSVVSRDTLGNAGNGASSQPTISAASGQFIAFASLATNVAAISGGSGAQIFLRDMQGNQSTLVSQDNSTPAIAGAGASAVPAIVGNGDFVAFSSLASNLVAGSAAPPDIYVRATP